MNKHDFNIFPDMNSDEKGRLFQDIKNNGYDEKNPIYLYEGKILDGWNRFCVCKELGIEPVYKEFQGTKIEAIQFVMRTNKRRNLTSSQWACIAIDAEDIVNAIKAEAKERQVEGGKNKGLELIPKAKKTHTSEKVADLFNTNEKYIRDAEKYKKEMPEIFESIKQGEKTITEVKKEQKIEKRKAEIDKIKKSIEKEPLPIDGLFDVVVLDPPWPYGREYNPQTSRVANPYPEMKTEEIEKIKIPIKENAVVFLWTTHAFIKDAFKLLKKWDLKYKAIIVWDKEKMGMGSTIRMQCEFCLLATKGNPIIQGASERDIIRERRREHSRKPDSFYSMVDRLCVGRKLDYFSREKRNGWVSYGAETEKF